MINKKVKFLSGIKGIVKKYDYDSNHYEVILSNNDTRYI